MNFGDILDQWEKSRFPRSGARKPSPQAEGPRAEGDPAPKPAPPLKPPPRSDPLTEWLRLNPVYDKDAGVQESSPDRGERRRRLLRKRPDAVIDLHGLKRDEAWVALENFFEEGRRRGLEKLLVIHGKGNHSVGEGLLKRLTARFIENCPFAGEWGHSPARGGGGGASWVILKNGGKRPENGES